MATSGSYDFSLTSVSIVQQVLENCLRIAPGETPATADNTTVRTQLNLIVKEIANEGIRLWTLDWRTKTFSASSEVTGTDGNIYTCIRSHTSSATDTPVTGADYSTYWVQKGSTGGVWATPTSYSAIGDFVPTADVIGIHSAFMRRNNTDSQIEIVPFPTYFNAVSNKYDTGVPDMLTFDMKLSPRIYLYPQPDNTDDVLHYLAETKLEDFDADANDPDFHARCLAFLVWETSYRCSFKYACNESDKSRFRQEAMAAWQRLKARDRYNTTGEFVEPAFPVRR